MFQRIYSLVVRGHEGWNLVFFFCHCWWPTCFLLFRLQINWALFWIWLFHDALMMFSLFFHTFYIDCPLGCLGMCQGQWCLLLFYSLQVLHARVSWWSSTGIWQKISSYLQDSSEHSGLSQQCYYLDGLDSSFDFQFSSPIFKPLETVRSTPTAPFMFHSFLVPWEGLSICPSLRFLLFPLCGPQERQIHKTASSLFLFFSFFRYLALGLVIWLGLEDLFVSQNSREFYASHPLGWALVRAYTIW